MSQVRQDKQVKRVTAADALWYTKITFFVFGMGFSASVIVLVKLIVEGP